MKVLVFVKATPNSEKGFQPDQDLSALFAEMGRFNEQLVKAGVMQEGDGLKPSSFGKRIKFNDGKAPTVTDGPFAETKELVAGYWIWNVKSVDEAVEWAKKCPNPMPGEEGVLEIRPTYAPEDFGGIASEEDLKRDERLRKELSRQLDAKAGAKKPRAKKPSATVRAKPRKATTRRTAKRKPAAARSKK